MKEQNIAPHQAQWGLVLSGGAAWGIANGGVLEALEEDGLKPDFIAGSSMGAIVGAVWAMGHDAKTLRSLLGKMKVSKLAVMHDVPLRNGLHGGLLRPRLREELGELLGGATIADCRIPFVCVAGRIRSPVKWHTIVKKGFTEHALASIEPYVFPPDTPLLDSILGSSAIPVLFAPARIGEEEFIDLCNFGSIPSRELRERYEPDIIVATDTTPRHRIIRNLLPGPWRDFLDAGNAYVHESKSACDLVIEPVLDTAPFRFDRATEFYEAGKKAMREKMPALRSLVA